MGLTGKLKDVTGLGGKKDLAYWQRLESLLVEEIEASAARESKALAAEQDASMTAIMEGREYAADMGKSNAEAANRAIKQANLVKVRGEIWRLEAEAAAAALKERWAQAVDARDIHVSNVEQLQAAVDKLARLYTDVLLSAEATYASVPVKPSHRPHLFVEGAIRTLVMRRLFGVSDGRFGEAAVSPFVASQDPSLVERLQGDLITLFSQRV